jgi:hypothetical protein
MEFINMQRQVMQDEFSLRYYHWAIRDFQREIYDEFPFLSNIKGLASYRLLNIMKQLHQQDQIEYASILVRRSHKRASEIIGNQLNGEEKSLWQSRSRMIFSPNKLINDNCEFQPKPANLNKKKLKFLVRDKLQLIMGNMYESEGYLLNYKVQLNKYWNLHTSIRIGGPSKLEYFHLICSSSQESFHLGPLAGIDLLRWFGIAGTTWDLISEVEIESAVDCLSLICVHFMQVAPGLVDGLVYENNP